MKRIFIALFVTITAVSTAFARERLPLACPVPTAYASALPRAAAARVTAAQAARQALSAEIANFEGQCTAVEVGGAQYKACVDLDATINVSIDAYLLRLNEHKAALAHELSTARSAAAGRVSALDTQIFSTRTKLAVDGHRIRGIETAAKEWEDASEDARAAMEKKAWGVLRDTFVDFSLKKISDRRQREILLDERQAANVLRNIQKFIVPKGVTLDRAQLANLFYWNHYVTAHGSTLAFRLTDNRSAVRFMMGLQQFNTMLDRVDAANAWLDDTTERERLLKAYAATLKLLVKEPELKFLINQWDMNFSLAFLFVTDHLAMERMEQLNQLGLKSLKGIEALSALHKRQVDTRVAFKRLQSVPASADSAGCPM